MTRRVVITSNSGALIPFHDVILPKTEAIRPDTVHICHTRNPAQKRRYMVAIRSDTADTVCY